MVAAVALYTSENESRNWLLALIAHAYSGNIRISSMMIKYLKQENNINEEDLNAAGSLKDFQGLLDYGYMRTRKKNPIEEDNFKERQLELLNEAVKSLPVYKPKKYVSAPKKSKKNTPQRAIDSQGVDINDYKVGSTYTAPSMMSFSRGEPKGEYAKRKYRLHITGEGALFDLGDLNKEQDEVLVPSGINFKVTNV